VTLHDFFKNTLVTATTGFISHLEKNIKGRVRLPSKSRQLLLLLVVVVVEVVVVAAAEAF